MTTTIPEPILLIVLVCILTCAITGLLIWVELRTLREHRANALKPGPNPSVEYSKVELGLILRVVGNIHSLLAARTIPEQKPIDPAKYKGLVKSEPEVESHGTRPPSPDSSKPEPWGDNLVLSPGGSAINIQRPPYTEVITTPGGNVLQAGRYRYSNMRSKGDEYISRGRVFQVKSVQANREDRFIVTVVEPKL